MTARKRWTATWRNPRVPGRGLTLAQTAGGGIYVRVVRGKRSMLSVDEAARALGWSVVSLYRLIARKQLVVTRGGGRILLPFSEVARLKQGKPAASRK